MNAKELIESLSKSEFIASELPMQTEMGLPLVRKTAKGAVVISFRPYKQVWRDTFWEIYPHSYLVEWVYPFAHVSAFKNLSVYNEIESKEPICTLSAETMLTSGLYLIDKLYEELDHVLAHLEEKKTVPDVVIAKYQNAYRRTVTELGLEALYFDKV